MRTFDQPGNVGHHERLIECHDRSQIRVLGGEWIVGDLGMGPRDPREQRRLAGVGKPDQAGVGDDLELHRDPSLFAGMAPLELPRGPVRRRFEMSIAVPAAAASSHDQFITGGLQVPQHVAAIAIADDRSRRAPR